MLLPEEDAWAARCLAQPIPSFCAHLRPLFGKNRPENWFSDEMRVTLVGPQEPSTLDERKINPVRFYVKTGRRWDVLTAGVSNMRIYLMCTYTSLLVNISARQGECWVRYRRV